MVSPDDLVMSPELSRSRTSKPFEERLRASIEAVGLAEPIKVAPLPNTRFLVIDGALRLQAIQGIRQDTPSKFPLIPAYVIDYSKRFEIRYQTDIYQDLLPSQLAALVEHMHRSEKIQKAEIARYIGVSPTTLRNYTGLWRLCERGGLFAQIVQLMDVGVIPSSNPFAWLRLTDRGIDRVLRVSFCDGEEPLQWIENCVMAARHGQVASLPLRLVESATNGLPPDCYREDEEVRNLKRSLGLRRSPPIKERSADDTSAAMRHLMIVQTVSDEPVLRSAAESLARYLR